MRFPGVLQKFAIAFLVNALLIYCFPINYQPTATPFFKTRVFYMRTAVILLFPITNLLFVKYLPVPDCPTGYLGPGGASDSG
jgi:heparan-alpha-glucosaminide N-acetyltransferase